MDTLDRSIDAEEHVLGSSWQKGVAVAAVAAAVVSLASASSHAQQQQQQQRRVTLRYSRGAGATHCADAATLKSAVSARLGYAPWDEKAQTVLVVSVTREREALRAHVLMRARGGGAVLGKRQLAGARDDCRELLASVVLAVALAIDPLSITRRPRAAPAAAPRREETPPGLTRKSKAPPPPPPRSGGPSISLGAGALVALGSAPAVAAGLAVRARLRWRRLSLGVEGRFDLPAGKDVPGGRVSTALLGGAGVGCLHFLRYLSGCGLVVVAALRSEARAAQRSEESTIAYAAGGLRLAGALPLFSVLSLQLSGDLLGTFTSITLLEATSGKQLWKTPPVSGAFTLALVARLR